MVQAFAPEVTHDTVTVPPILTRLGDTLIEAETVGSEGSLAVQELYEPSHWTVRVPELVCPQELAPEEQEMV